MSGMVYHILWWMVCAVSRLPLKVHYRISDGAAFVLHRIVRYRRDTVCANLARSFPDLKYGELKALTREYYRYMCDVIAESLWSAGASDEKICRVVRTENPEVMDAVCARHGKVIVMLGHRGNWELIGAVSGENAKQYPGHFSNEPIVLAYRRIKNKAFDRLMRKMRLRQFSRFRNAGGVVESGGILRRILRDDRERGVYMFIADQSPDPGERTLVRFLNQPTFMIGGPEYIARRLGLPVVFLDMERRGRGDYVIRFTLMTENAADTEPGFVTREYARLLERAICGNRSNWLWSHRRWKRIPTAAEMEKYWKTIEKQIDIKEETL